MDSLFYAYSKVFRLAGAVDPEFPAMNLENDASGNPLYVGYAPRGSADGDAVWWIAKYTYTDGFVTAVRTSTKAIVWNDRAAATYA